MEIRYRVASCPFSLSLYKPRPQACGPSSSSDSVFVDFFYIFSNKADFCMVLFAVFTAEREDKSLITVNKSMPIGYMYLLILSDANVKLRHLLNVLG